MKTYIVRCKIAFIRVLESKARVIKVNGENTIHSVQQKTGEKLFDIDLGNNTIYIGQHKHRPKTAKINKWDHIKLKNYIPQRKQSIK